MLTSRGRQEYHKYCDRIVRERREIEMDEEKRYFAGHKKKQQERRE